MINAESGFSLFLFFRAENKSINDNLSAADRKTNLQSENLLTDRKTGLHNKSSGHKKSPDDALSAQFKVKIKQNESVSPHR